MDGNRHSLVDRKERRQVWLKGNCSANCKTKSRELQEGRFKIAIGAGADTHTHTQSVNKRKNDDFGGCAVCCGTDVSVTNTLYTIHYKLLVQWICYHQQNLITLLWGFM